MKKQFYCLSILFIALTSTFTSCKKDAPADTSLSITVSDELGNKVSGASVALYATQADFNTSTNPVATKLTDATGTVTFNKLSSVKYLWEAIKDCKNNANGGFSLASELPINVATKINTVITATGFLKFVNNSTNPYSIYINGVLNAASLAGGYSQTFSYVPIGSYTLRVLQLSGYILTPTDKTYTGTVTCGSTLSTTFP